MADGDFELQTPRSTLVSRNITVLGHRTSVRLEPEMWSALREIAKRERCNVHDICSLIQLRKNPNTSLTAAIRVFLMLYFRAATTEEGHRKANHGSFNSMMHRARVTEDMLRAISGAGEGAASMAARRRNAVIAGPFPQSSEASEPVYPPAGQARS